MVYIVTKQPPRYYQMTFEDLIAGVNDISKYCNPMNSDTRTIILDKVNEKLLEKVDIAALIDVLKTFNQRYSFLFEANRTSLYHSFSIPKKTGGLRRIDAPNVELMEALRQLKYIFEVHFGALYHTSAFAYIKGRSTVDTIKRHQNNESSWFMKLDFSDFFGSTTMRFLIKQLSLIFPFSEVIKKEEGYIELAQAVSLCFLNRGLPQGTPISPLLTNLLMIPIDHKLFNTLRNFNKQYYVYTRYADDILISSKYDFDYLKVQNYVKSILSDFDVPYVINPQKTRYGSRSGSNWNLGLMLNKDNKITIGYRKKRMFKAMLCSFVTDKLNSVMWEKSDIKELEGLINYYKMVEKDYIEFIVNKLSLKFNVNIKSLINELLKS